jgi:carbamate kinase
MSQRKPRVVIALGGNALGKTLPEQMAAVKITSKAIVDLIDEGYQVIISHGNGPQVGMINNAMAALSRENPQQPNTPLSVCVAMSQAYIGYDLQNALREELCKRRSKGEQTESVVTIVTQIEIDPVDSAFLTPSKPIGHYMTKEQAAFAAQEYGYFMKEFPGKGWRRVVASPRPKKIVELNAIRTLVDAGQIVIACGGGGIPVTQRAMGHLKGASAVIDKDFCSCLLAKELEAEFFIILTAVEKVAIHFGTPEVEWLDELTPELAEQYIQEGQFEAGSMLPKVQAAIEFAQSGEGRTALITQLEKAKEGILGRTGTRIHK